MEKPLYVLSISSLLWGLCQGGRILALPLDWLNVVIIIIKALHSRVHAVDVIRSNQNWYIQDGAQSCNTITVAVDEGFNHAFIVTVVKKIIDVDLFGTLLVCSCSF